MCWQYYGMTLGKRSNTAVFVGQVAKQPKKRLARTGRGRAHASDKGKTGQP
jgi:hypothetical protein